MLPSMSVKRSNTKIDYTRMTCDIMQTGSMPIDVEEYRSKNGVAPVAGRGFAGQNSKGLGKASQKGKGKSQGEGGKGKGTKGKGKGKAEKGFPQDSQTGWASSRGRGRGRSRGGKGVGRGGRRGR